MAKRIHEFNDLIRKLRKEQFGKGPERIHTKFAENMAISTLYGNLTPTEKFIAKTENGKEMVHLARTKMIQEVYSSNPPHHLEEVVGAKLVHLFTDIKVEEDIAVSVFVFDQNIEREKDNHEGDL
ncbi:DUF2294 domain-containing protein [Heyndrickxia acidicola]|uniref:DUF2294 domain-containing protein n=1 Tax=Heyndrickxia acidicola TaxID=209389 RepID=A0ABU6MAI1_9BACI|nr:DUF2294 domain-containing protein [Heyndrickxia acidicola]MED1201664.1 DUF2294 domain-containing protein [Heyndrickxia acidicola]